VDDTPASAFELSEFQRTLDRFEVRHTLVVAISHNTLRSHLRFATRCGLTFPLLADLAADVARPYGAKGLLPFFKRRTVVIDGRGVLRLVSDGVPDVEALLTFIDGLAGDLPEP
jgi:peroxiredoxin Q/BCP